MRCRAHGFAFALQADDAALGEYIADLYAPLVADVQPQGCYRIRRDSRWVLTWGEEQLAATSSLGRALATLQWHINQQVIATATERTLLHAAAAARDGRAVLLPAAMEAGKSTLCGGLVRAGWAYLGDEATGLAGTTAIPYPKPLSLDRGSWELLPELRPPEPPGLEGITDRQWQVPVGRLRDDAIAGPTPIAHVMLPCYEAGAATTLEVVHPAEAVPALAACTFGWHQGSAQHFRVLCELLDTVPVWRLVSGDLDDAVATIDALWRQP